MGAASIVFVCDSNPGLDIRLVFSDANKKIYKDSPTTYAQWCEDHGFMWSTKGEIPCAWIEELKHIERRKARL
jgi:hypothetical protein